MIEEHSVREEISSQFLLCRLGGTRKDVSALRREQPQRGGLLGLCRGAPGGAGATVRDAVASRARCGAARGSQGGGVQHQGAPQDPARAGEGGEGRREQLPSPRRRPLRRLADERQDDGPADHRGEHEDHRQEDVLQDGRHLPDPDVQGGARLRRGGPRGAGGAGGQEQGRQQGEGGQEIPLQARPLSATEKLQETTVCY